MVQEENVDVVIGDEVAAETVVVEAEEATEEEVAAEDIVVPSVE